MKKHSRLIALLLALLVMPFPMLSARSENAAGLVRVKLTKLNLTDRVDIALDGCYTLGDIAFQRGSHLTVSCTTGTLMVYYEGMALDAGKEMTLLRHACEPGLENGFRVNGAYPLHPGDLILSIQGGHLLPVLRAPVEEYLLGVVPYEMSDSFPIEALKAQAVAARTYALRKAAAATGDYDLVDNTNDQAYNGVKAENVNAAAAVRETAGMCCFYQNALAQCYYTASNGGQTELGIHAWGDPTWDGAMQMTDDPFDVENPASQLLTFTVQKAVKSWDDLKALAPFAKGAISEPVEAMGYDPDTVRPVVVKDVAFTSPLYPGTESRVMTKLSFSMTIEGEKTVVSGPEEEVSIFSTASSAPVEPEVTTVTAQDTVPVVLDVLPDLRKALSLAINSSPNEIFTVRETEESYILESRRYGHGVGMSQRGAEQMAGVHGWKYDQILKFYYPGMVLKKMEFAYTLPSAPNAAFLATPGPAATPTPRPTAYPVMTTPGPDEYAVWVTNIGVNSFLNLRAESNAQSSVLEQLYYGQKLIVEKDLGDWLQVRTDTKRGFVMKEFVGTQEGQ